MMKRIKLKKRKIKDANTQSQPSSAQKDYEVEDCPAEITCEVKKNLRKGKKGVVAPDVKEENKAKQNKYDHLNSLNPSKKKKRKPKETITEADEISLEKKLTRKKKLTSLKLEKRAERIEIDGDSGEITGSLKRRQSRNKMGKETETEAEIPEFKMGKETEMLANVDEFDDCGTVNKCLGGRESESDKKKSSKSLKKKKKKLSAPGSKRRPTGTKIETLINEIEDVQSPKKKLRLDTRYAELEANLGADVAEEISAVDEDDSKGMKSKWRHLQANTRCNTGQSPDFTQRILSKDVTGSKGSLQRVGSIEWLNEYWNSRPGLTALQQRIDEFIVSHEAKEEQARKEQEALAAEGGWTVVVRHKGKKKTTDSETGVSVGSVAPAAVMDIVVKKKKEIPLDFYRFQRREAQRNEVMMLQSKFEQDKKRIQQLRAARKFRPY